MKATVPAKEILNKNPAYNLSNDNLVCTVHALLEFAYRVQKITR